MAVLASACGTQAPQWTTLQGNAQGSTFTITYHDSLGRDLRGSVDSLFQVIDQSLSLWVEGSTVLRFNAADTTFTTNDRHFQVLLALAQRQWYNTQGAFDPTVLPLVRAWGLGKEGRATLDTTMVDSLLRCVGMQRIRLPDGHGDAGDARNFRKAAPCIQFDPNGIAQGYTVDMLALLLRMRGIERYMVEVGGEVRTSGVNERGQSWTIQIDKPVEGVAHERQTVVPLMDRALATSGNYRKFIEINGRRYGHTIDPRTGRPAMNALLSASVIADDCATADALGTALMVMGPQPAIEWLQQHPEVEAYLILDNRNGGYHIWSTPGWPEAEEPQPGTAH